MNTQEQTRLRARSRWLRWAVTGLLGLLLLVALLSLWAEVNLASDVAKPGALLHEIVGWSVFWAPAAFYVWALWAIRRALGDVASGRLLQPALARSLRDVGLGLTAGALTSTFVQPNLMRMMANAGWSDGAPFASFAHFDVAYFAVGAIGLALVLLSRVLHHAAEVQAELDEII